MHVVVTGGAGFIGSRLVERLVGQGHAVRVLDNFSTGRQATLARVREEVTIVEGDVRSPDDVWRAVQGCDRVFHLAALVSVAQSVAEPLLAYDVNCTGSLTVLDAARRAGVGRVVLASTCAVYGDVHPPPLNEDDPAQPRSPYAASKLAAEQACQLYTELYGLETAVLRFFNVYGPGQPPDSAYAAVVPKFLAALRLGEQPTIYGDGRQTRDFIFVEDVVEALLLAATSPQAVGGLFNVGRGEAVGVRDLAALLAELLQTPLEPRFAPARYGEVQDSRADTTRSRMLLGFQARHDLRAGLLATMRASDGPA